MSLLQVVQSALDVDLARARLSRESQRFAANVLRSTIGKKFIAGGNISPLAKKAAIDLFIENNSKCSNFTLKPSKWIHSLIIDEVKTSLFSFWNTGRRDQCDFAKISDLGRNLRPGPGASIAAKETDAFSKLYWGSLSSTDSDLYDLYQRLVSYYPLESEAECIRRIRFSSTDVTSVRGSHLSVVPKTTEIGRSICTEPSINMMFQLSLGTILEERLWQVFGIRLESQPDKNRVLARMGSISGDLATIDLKSASDTISLTLLDEILPPGLLALVKRLRSPAVRLPDGRWIDLHMVSTMGNGFTFPLQTLIFTCVVQACYRIHGFKLDLGRLNKRGRFGVNQGYLPFGVFGDDIIVDVQCFHTVLEALSLFGFTINHDKTFSEGHFRESCGHDYLKGVNVRGVYLKRLDEPQDFYVAVNRLNEWSALHNVPLPLTVQYLLSKVRFLPIPRHESDDGGVKVPLALAPIELDENGSIKYRCYRSIPRTWVPTADSNPPGLLLAAIRGYVKNGKLNRRSNRRRYKLIRNVSPCWEHSDDADHRKSVLLGQRWNTAVTFNLFG